MANLRNMTKAQLLAMVTQLAEETETAEPIRARQFSSLGFVAVGDGPAPTEGQVIDVPLAKGGTAKVRVLHQVDTSPYAGEFGEWAFTYKRLRRGESE